MNIGVKLTQEDYIAFNIYHAFHSKLGKRSVLHGRLMMAYGAAAMELIELIRYGEVFYFRLILLAAASVVWYFVWPGCVRRSVRRQVQRLAKQGKLPYPEESELDFGEDEIVETTPTSVQKTAYADVMDLRESADHIFVYVGAIQAIILPKHCVEGREDELKALLMEKCPRLK